MRPGPLLTTVLVLGLLLVVFGIPLASGKVKPNGFYGYRTPRTVSNPELWYKVNVFTGRTLSICGTIMVLGALLLQYLVRYTSLNNGRAAVLGVVLLIVPSAVGALVTVIYGEGFS